MKSDTLTGDATAVHRTNVMFIQQEELEVKPVDWKIDKADIARTIEQSADDYNKLTSFKACERKTLPICEKHQLPTMFEKGTSNQRTKAVIHTSARKDEW